MPPEVPSPTAIQIDIERKVVEMMSNRPSDNGLVVDRSDIAKLTLAQLLARKQSLGTWTEENETRQETDRVMSPRAKASESELNVAISVRRVRVRKWLELSENPKRMSIEELAQRETDLLDGSDSDVVAAWRTFAKTGTCDRQDQVEVELASLVEPVRHLDRAQRVTEFQEPTR